MIPRMCLLVVSLSLLLRPSSTAITRSTIVNDIHGNLLSNNDVKFPASTCCVVPTCNSPDKCYQMVSCGYLCSTGKYAPAEFSYTPGYKLKPSYRKFDCLFEDCKQYEITCNHCQSPREPEFSIYLVREDCKECYYQ
ncbi:unnamed protein product [Ceutorhynchus assimilis]|uniref:Uncharacterized protein n=1 Tax=Ceutorhynchus assimilis TaxID=467358 RepID=A0A9P0GMA4_9CUCU|nr:unnamed protein product [Ceutorhynchus assimilis]